MSTLTLEECPICLEVRADQHLLECLHRACMLCVSDIGNANNVCPLCKTRTECTLPLTVLGSDCGCARHALPVTMYCATCDDTVCGECLCEPHSHNLISSKTLLVWLHSYDTRLSVRLLDIDVFLTELTDLKKTLQRHAKAERLRITMLLGDQKYADRRVELMKQLDAAVTLDFKLLEDDIASQRAIVERVREICCRLEFVFGKKLESHAMLRLEAEWNAMMTLPLKHAVFMLKRARAIVDAPQSKAPLLKHGSFLCLVEPVTPASAACAYIGRSFLYRKKNFDRKYEGVNFSYVTPAICSSAPIDELPDGDIVCIQEPVGNMRVHIIDRQTLRAKKVFPGCATRVRVCPAGLIWMLVEVEQNRLRCVTRENVHVRTISGGPGFRQSEILDFLIARSGLVLTMFGEFVVMGFLPDGTEVFRTWIGLRNPHFGPLLEHRFSVMPSYVHPTFTESRCKSYDLATGAVCRHKTRWLSSLTDAQAMVPVPGHSLLWFEAYHDRIVSWDWQVPPRLSTQPQGAIFWAKHNLRCTFLHDGSLVAKGHSGEFRLMQWWS